MSAPDAAVVARAVVAAHHGVVFAARERQEAVRTLVALAANADKEGDDTCAHLELELKVAQLTEKHKGAVDAVEPGGITPLILVGLQGRVDDVTALLALGADPAIEGDVSSISIPDEKYKCAPLMLAARDGHIEIMKVLLAHARVDANQASSDTGRTSLWVACYSGYAAVVKLLLAHAGIFPNQARTDSGKTPLYIACQNGHAAVVKLLLAHDGIAVNKATDMGVTPICIACTAGHSAIVKLLLVHGGIAVNKAMDAGATPLSMACEEGHAEIVKVLLPHGGIDANQARTNTGTTPLLMACQNGHAAVVKLLLAHAGVDLNKAMDGGATPLFMACEQGHAAVVKLLLVHAGVHVNAATTDDGVTPLYMACHEGHTAVVKLLLTHDGIDLNQTTTDTIETPLHAAIVGEALPLFAMQYLVVYGASLAAEDEDGVTPAQRATSMNKLELAEWLNAVCGWSQLQVAAGCRLYKDAAFLLRRGKIDPDDTATTTVKDVMAAVATSHAKPAALPWQNAAPVCRATIKLVADATRGWHRTTHWLHHKAVRNAVFAVLVVAERLQTKGALPAEAPADARAATDTADTTAEVPLLPIEIWLFAMWFFQRSWWAVQ